MSAWCDRHSDEYRDGRRDFERRGSFGYDRDLYREWGDRAENYTAGFNEAKREEERRKERRQEEQAEEERQRRMAAQQALERQQEEDEFYRQQEEQQPEPQQPEPDAAGKENAAAPVNKTP